MIFPVILALLGDNPMHSEFACHVGLRGRLFCRTCRVWRGGFMRGAGEADQDEDSNSHEDIDLDNAETPSEVDADMQTAPRKTLGERTLTHIRRRLAAFIKVCRLLIIAVTLIYAEMMLPKSRVCLVIESKLENTFTSSSTTPHAYAPKLRFAKPRQ